MKSSSDIIEFMFNYYLSNVYIHAKSIALHRVFGAKIFNFSHNLIIYRGKFVFLT